MPQIPVMIVDDEVLAVEYLRGMIDWEAHGYPVVAEATNGRKALELLQKRRPRVAFVDIRMPVMDGLAFCDAAKAIDPELQVIFLTAYKDFDYARKAVELGAGNYILKHDVKPETILAALGKARAALERQERSRRANRQSSLRELLRGARPEPGGGAAGIVPGRAVLLALRVDRPCPVTGEAVQAAEYFPVPQPGSLPDAVESVEAVETGPRSFACLVALKGSYGRHEAQSALHDLARRMQRAYREQAGATLSVAASDFLAEPDGLGEQYARLVNALELAVFTGRESVYLAESLPAARQADAARTGRALQALEAALRSGEREALRARLDELFEAASFSPPALREACAALGRLLGEYRRTNLLEDEAGGAQEAGGRLYDAAGIRAWFLESFLSAMDRAAGRRYGELSRKMQRALLYIHEHYREDISIDQVAADAGISGVYLTKLFSRELGQSFLDCLTRCRVEAAARLLESGRYRVYEVAGMVGYKSGQYFSQVFRKYTGKSPFDVISGEAQDEAQH